MIEPYANLYRANLTRADLYRANLVMAKRRLLALNSQVAS